jgi:hypothetical protein
VEVFILKIVMGEIAQFSGMQSEWQRRFERVREDIGVNLMALRELRCNVRFILYFIMAVNLASPYDTPRPA